MAEVVAEEFYGASQRTSVWVRETSRPSEQQHHKPLIVRKRTAAELEPLYQSLATAFLPVGYPESVTADYLEFQVWDSLQGLSTYIRSMLSTQVLLGGLGVGQTSATALSATFHWFVRDLAGMLGGILFTFLKGSNLDSNAKQWRLAADIINDVGMLMDLVSPLYPPAFLPVLCLGSISRAITGTASGATRAALTQHFALQQNAADISAKEGSQETVATMLGMLLGMLLVRLVADSVPTLWLVFLLLTAFHVYANYRAVHSLCLTSLNRGRTFLLLKAYLETGKVPSPREIAKHEQILPWPQGLSPRGLSSKPGPSLLLAFHPYVDLGCSLTRLCSRRDSHSGSGALCLAVHVCSWEELEESLRRYGKGHYLLSQLQHGGPLCVVLHRNANKADHLRAYVHALLLGGRRTPGDPSTAAMEALRWMASQFPDFCTQLAQAGWALEHVVLAPQEWRADWVSPGSD